jgi:hypothetical protein
MATARPDRERGAADRPDDGAEPVPERPPDLPGKGRTISMWIVAILAFLVLAVPVAWGIGVLAAYLPVLGDTANAIVWITWALVIAAFVWVVWAMWRRSA